MNKAQEEAAERRAKVKRLAASCTNEEIARRLDCSVRTVIRDRVKLGLARTCPNCGERI